MKLKFLRNDNAQLFIITRITDYDYYFHNILHYLVTTIYTI